MVIFGPPRTFMLNAIRDWITDCPFDPHTALGIDRNPTLIEILTSKWPWIEITEASYPEHDAQDLSSFQDECFDIVFSHQVIEHIPKPWRAADAMNRVLKTGGLGIHTTCAYNPRHGLPSFNDYYRFLPDGLEQLWDGQDVLVKEGWGNRQAILYNLAIDDGHGTLGGRRFSRAVGEPNDPDHPWVTWIIYQKRA